MKNIIFLISTVFTINAHAIGSCGFATERRNFNSSNTHSVQQVPVGNCDFLGHMYARDCKEAADDQNYDCFQSTQTSITASTIYAVQDIRSCYGCYK
jgi:hypothetical protein